MIRHPRSLVGSRWFLIDKFDNSYHGSRNCGSFVRKIDTPWLVRGAAVAARLIKMKFSAWSVQLSKISRQEVQLRVFWKTCRNCGSSEVNIGGQGIASHCPHIAVFRFASRICGAFNFFLRPMYCARGVKSHQSHCQQSHEYSAWGDGAKSERFIWCGMPDIGWESHDSVKKVVVSDGLA